MTNGIESIKQALSLIHQVIDLLKSTRTANENAVEKSAIEESLNQASSAASLAEIQIAETLGYELCRCTFPPQIMLSQGYVEVRGKHSEEFVCPRCAKSSVPPPPKPSNPRFPRRYKHLR